MSKVTTPCSGGTVTSRMHTFGAFNSYFDHALLDRLRRASESRWRMLTRRLRYPGSNKARNALRRLPREWEAEDVKEALCAMTSSKVRP